EEDAPDGGASERVAEVRESALDSAVAPRGVLGDHAHYQLHKGITLPGATGPTLCAAVVLGSNELPIPAKERVGRDDSAELKQLHSGELFGGARKPPALGVGEPQAPGPELLSQHAVFGLEVFDGLLLLAVEPAGRDQQNEAQGEGHRGGLRRANRPASTEDARGSPPPPF